MLKALWLSTLVNPLHNILAVVVGFLPYGDIGFAVIILTIFVKIILFPISRKSIISQIKLKQLEPKINELKEKITDKQEQAKATFDLYKKEGVNPFSGCLLALIQLPIILALFSLFRNGVHFNENILYSFVSIPESVNYMFLGFIDINSKNIIIAILVGITQYIQTTLVMGKNTNNTSVTKQDFQADLNKAMQTQMKYILPIMMVFFSYIGTVVIALYFLTSNIVTIIQEYMLRKKFKSVSSV